MSNREVAIDLINKLPAETSLYDIAREIEFVAGVRQGLAEAERGEGVSVEEARLLLKEWTCVKHEGSTPASVQIP